MPLQEFAPSQVGSGSPTGLTAGQIVFPSSTTSLTGTSALFWDNTNHIFKLSGSPVPTFQSTNSDGNQVILTQRVAGDNLVNALTTGGDIRILDPANGGRQCDMTFYTFGVSMCFNTNPSAQANGSLFEFHGWQQSSLHAGSYLPTAILSILTGSDTIHEVHVRPVADNDGIIFNYPTGAIPVIYTDTVSGTSTALDFGVYRTRLFRIQTDGPPITTVYNRFTGSAANQDLILELTDNQFSGSKGQVVYKGTASAGSRYFGLLNNGADYIKFSSDVLRFYDSVGTTERARFIAGGNFGLNTTTPRAKLDIIDTASPQIYLTYTDNSVYTSFQTNSSGNLYIKPTGSQMQLAAASATLSITGSATNQNIDLELTDNNVTLKGRLLYAGANGAGSRYFGVINSGADYLAISSDSIRFLNLAFTESFRIDSNLTFHPRVSLATGMTTGFINIPGAAGAPSGTPATTTGFPLYWDSTNLQLYVYTGGAWKKSAAFT